MNLFHALHSVASGLQAKSAPLPLELNDLGQVGHLSKRQGVYVNSALRRHVRGIYRDHQRLERYCRERSRGLFGAELADVARRITGYGDSVRAAKTVLNAFASWDDVVTTLGNGKSASTVYLKNQMFSNNGWSSMVRQTGLPGAATVASIPGGGVLNGDSAGAMPLPRSVTSSEQLYLLNNAFTSLGNGLGAHVAILMDVVVSAGGIATTVTTTQDVSSTALSRWTNGENINMILEATATIGSTAANITLTYTNQGGTGGRSTDAIVLATGRASINLITPQTYGPMIQLQAGDYGVRSVESVLMSGSMGGSGTMALHLAKFLKVYAYMTGSVHHGFPQERTTPAQTGGITALKDGVGGELPFLSYLGMGGNWSNQPGIEHTFFWGAP